ncbi:MAG: hypothetical protein DRQ13_03120 [Ignavibacteriae bacterium]|nr:MAG: hypothetical protein DRQ13_03120 [Ignavibacteriota bacterium]
MNTTRKLTRKEREKELHKMEILESAIKIFSKYGYAEATVEKIAADCQFGKGSLYIYFPSKKILFIESFKYAFGEFYKETSNSLNEGKTLQEKLIFYTIVLIKFFNEKRNWFALLENAFYNKHLDKQVKKAYDAQLSKFSEQLLVLFRKEYNKGNEDLLNPSFLAQLFNHYIYLFLHQDTLKKNFITPDKYEKIAKELVTFFFQGFNHYVRI